MSSYKKKKKAPIARARPDVLEYVVNQFAQGYNNAEIKEECVKRFPELGLSYINLQIAEAKKIIKNQYEKDLDSIVSVHTKRYEREIQRLLKFVPSSADYEKARIQEIENYLNLLDVLQHKEKLYGLHSKSVNIQINNMLNVKVNIKKFNLSDLEMSEKIELLHLIEKTKRSENEMHGIVEEDVTVANNLIEATDTEYFEVIEDNNVDKIEKTKIIPVPEIIPNMALKIAKDKLREALMKEVTEKK